jgi:hypothetical protein
MKLTDTEKRVLADVAHYGYCSYVKKGELSDDWLQEHKLLVIRGTHADHVMPDSRQARSIRDKYFQAEEKIRREGTYRFYENKDPW